MECMVALPVSSLPTRKIRPCIWFLTRDKRNGLALNKTKRDRRRSFLFIDARQLWLHERPRCVISRSMT